MAKHIQLSVSSPCHEDWDKMSRAEKGRFCEACQKQVIDFSVMSDAQLAMFFKKQSTGTVCGRFTEDQLNRDLAIPKKRIPWLKYFFQFAIPAFLGSAKLYAQGGVKATVVQVANEHSSENKMVNDTIPGRLQPIEDEVYEVRKTTMLMGIVAVPIDFQNIHGRVIDEKGRPIPFAKVEMKGTGRVVITDEDGEFTIATYDRWKKIVLLTSSSGFVSSEEKIKRQKYGYRIDIVLKTERKQQTGEVAIQQRSVPNNVINDSSSLINTNSMEIHPNPVQSGETINIRCGNIEENYYSLQWFSLHGQMVEQKEIWIDKEATVLNLSVPKVPAGTYFIRMTNKESGKVQMQKIIIF